MKKIIITIIILLVLSFGVYYFLFQNSQRYTNTKFDYSIVIPGGYVISEYSAAYDTGLQLITEEFNEIHSYGSVDEMKTKNPELFEKYTKEFEKLHSLWNAETSQGIILSKENINDKTLDELLSSPEVIVIRLSDMSFIESGKSSELISVKDIIVNDGVGQIIETNFDSEKQTTLVFEFKSNEKLYDGNDIESITFSFRGDLISVDDVLGIVETLR